MGLITRFQGIFKSLKCLENENYLNKLNFINFFLIHDKEKEKKSKIKR